MKLIVLALTWMLAALPAAAANVPTRTAAATPAGAPAATPEIAAPAAPTGPRLSGFADLMFDGTVGESAPETTLDFTPGTVLGTLPLAFEKTRLVDIAALYGGETHSQGDAGAGVTWLCYTRHAATKADTPRTAWFTSTAEMSNPGTTLSMVVVENVDAATTDGCATAPKAFPFPSFGVPAIGATAGDIRKRFGSLPRDRSGNVYFNSTRALNDGSGQSVYQSLGYVIGKAGIVRAVALSQVTTD